MDKWIYINDHYVRAQEGCLPYTDLAIQRGYGIFDFLKVVNRTPVFIEDHLNRFYNSALEMRLPVKQSRQELKEIITLIIARNKFRDCGIKIILTGGDSSDGYQLSNPNLLIVPDALNSPNEDVFNTGIKLVTYKHQRQLPQVKTIDYLMAIWLQPFIKENHADDVLYHNNGIITECPRANFFIVTADNIVVTPGANILKGITRTKVKEMAHSITVIEERDISLNDLRTAKAAFISSTTKLILPVTKIDDITYPANNNLVRELRARLQTLIKNETENIPA